MKTPLALAAAVTALVVCVPAMAEPAPSQVSKLLRAHLKTTLVWHEGSCSTNLPPGDPEACQSFRLRSVQCRPWVKASDYCTARYANRDPSAGDVMFVAVHVWDAGTGLRWKAVGIVCRDEPSGTRVLCGL